MKNLMGNHWGKNLTGMSGAKPEGTPRAEK